MRPSRLVLLTLALGALAACSAPATTGSSSSSSSGTPFVPDTPSEYGPGDYCADTYVIIQETTRANFSLGSEYYRNGDYCAAYPYIKHLIATEPLFTGEDPDDRNFLRMARIYEVFAAEVDSTNRADRVAYLDSSLMMRERGVELMEENNIAYDPYLRYLNEGFFFFSNSAYYDDAEEKQFQAFSRALEAQPDSLEDWYINQLFVGSAEVYGNDRPNPERGAYLRQLAQVVDSEALQANYVQYADYVEADPTAQGEIGIVEDTAVIDLIASLRANSLEGDDALSLLALVLQQPERIEALNEDVAELRSLLLRLPAVTNQVDNPRTLYALALQNYGDGNRAEGDRLFDRAISNAQSNAQRADFHYSRGVSRYGGASDFTRALEYFPQHGPSLYRRALAMADAVGRPTSVRGRFAYWCLADQFRNVAASTNDSRIAGAARRAAAQYDRSGPSREQYFLEGFSPGQSVSSSLGAYGSCTTRVR